MVQFAGLRSPSLHHNSKFLGILFGCMLRTAFCGTDILVMLEGAVGRWDSGKDPLRSRRRVIVTCGLSARRHAGPSRGPASRDNAFHQGFKSGGRMRNPRLFLCLAAKKVETRADIIATSGPRGSESPPSFLHHHLAVTSPPNVITLFINKRGHGCSAQQGAAEPRCPQVHRGRQSLSASPRSSLSSQESLKQAIVHQQVCYLSGLAPHVATVPGVYSCGWWMSRTSLGPSGPNSAV
ncbi:hypothetical protein SAMN05192541_14556 [Bradyrhizobium arachidis]|nr:hypothetical protein SAMN05192541_14556 [Bradyrhizobium arachidis]